MLPFPVVDTTEVWKTIQIPGIMYSRKEADEIRISIHEDQYMLNQEPFHLHRELQIYTTSTYSGMVKYIVGKDRINKISYFKIIHRIKNKCNCYQVPFSEYKLFEIEIKTPKFRKNF